MDIQFCWCAYTKITLGLNYDKIICSYCNELLLSRYYLIVCRFILCKQNVTIFLNKNINSFLNKNVSLFPRWLDTLVIVNHSFWCFTLRNLTCLAGFEMYCVFGRPQKNEARKYKLLPSSIYFGVEYYEFRHFVSQR